MTRQEGPGRYERPEQQRERLERERMEGRKGSSIEHDGGQPLQEGRSSDTSPPGATPARGGGTPGRTQPQEQDGPARSPRHPPRDEPTKRDRK